MGCKCSTDFEDLGNGQIRRFSTPKESGASLNLPDGWEAVMDSKVGEVFWVNHNDGSTHRNKPEPPEPPTCKPPSRHPKRPSKVGSVGTGSDTIERSTDFDEVLECCVCCDREMNVMTPCFHKFCHVCLINLTDKRCPVCRTPYKDHELVDLKYPNKFIQVPDEFVTLGSFKMNTVDRKSPHRRKNRKKRQPNRDSFSDDESSDSGTSSSTFSSSSVTSSSEDSSIESLDEDKMREEHNRRFAMREEARQKKKRPSTEKRRNVSFTESKKRKSSSRGGSDIPNA